MVRSERNREIHSPPAQSLSLPSGAILLETSTRKVVLTPSCDAFVCIISSNTLNRHHYKCVLKVGVLTDINLLVGFDSLRWDDQQVIRKALGFESLAVTATAVAVEEDEDGGKKGKAKKAGGRAKKTAIPVTEEPEEVRKQREASEKLWKTKDEVKSKYGKEELRAILKHNNQSYLGLSPGELIDRVADGMVNGALPLCKECHGHLHPSGASKVKCHGHLSAWSRCTFEAEMKDIVRAKWKNPSAATIDKLMDEIKDEKAAEKAYATGAGEDGAVSDSFKGLVFVLLGDWETQDDDVAKIEQGGGTVSSTFTPKVTHVLATYDEVSNEPPKRAPAKRTKALASDLPVLDPCVIQYCTAAKKTLAYLDNVADFAVWVGGKATKPDDAKTKPKQNTKKRRRLVIPPIDKDCEYREDYQIYSANNSVYAITLNMTDLTVGDRGRNSLYIMQCLQHKSRKNNFAIFFKWGRIGSDNSSKIDDYTKPADMIKAFEKKFFEMTHNHWEAYMNNEFEKKPKGYFPVDLDVEDDEEEESEKLNEAVKERKRRLAEIAKDKPAIEKLDPRVAELISLIFNKEMINKQMAEMKIDTKKMPLGQLSKRTLREGVAILEKIESLIKEEGFKETALQDLCNQFYTKVPHDFGNTRPPLIKTAAQLQEKYDLVDFLMDVEVAARMLEAEAEHEDPLLKKYKELGNTITALDRASDEWKRLETYVKNTQDSVNLKILDIYRVDRHGEQEIFSKWDHLEHRKLLFHGSNVAVFPAILSGGIKIMPHSGGRVGRGNYSADMIYKSQGYCGLHGNVGLILLNEVVLGKQNRIYKDNSSLVKAPSGHDSVLACGQQHPDPKKEYLDTTLSHSGHPVIIPQGGKSNQADAKNSSFIHNEYLVYDASMVHMRYLLRLEWPNRNGYY